MKKRKKRPVQEGREPLCGALRFPGRDITMLRNHYLGVGRTREQEGDKHPERRLEENGNSGLVHPFVGG